MVSGYFAISTSVVLVGIKLASSLFETATSLCQPAVVYISACSVAVTNPFDTSDVDAVSTLATQGVSLFAFTHGQAGAATQLSVRGLACTTTGFHTHVAGVPTVLMLFVNAIVMPSLVVLVWGC